MKRYKATAEVMHEEWEAIQASFSVDLREGEERYNETVADGYYARLFTVDGEGFPIYVLEANF